MDDTMNGNGNGNGWWRIIGPLLASTLMTGLIAWFAFGRDAASREELQSLRVQIAADNMRFQDSLTSIRSTVDTMNGALQAQLRLQERDRDERRR